MDSNLLLVGCGKMGTALLRGWLSSGFKSNDILIIEPDEKTVGFPKSQGVRVINSVEMLDQSYEARVVVFAVKPHSMGAVLPAYQATDLSNSVVLSIAAGITLDFLEGHLGTTISIVRAMPNTPAAIGRGMTALCANKTCTTEDCKLTAKLMGTVGEIEWIKNETMFDAITGVSGSGPAYLFYFIECLAEAGVAEGLPVNLAKRLALETVAGSAELCRLSTDELSILRQDVTSAGGTTEAGLGILMGKEGLRKLIERTVGAASRRSRELTN